MHLIKKNSFIFIFSSLLDIRPLFEIYFWPCSINSRYMLQLPVLRHCFSSYNSHDLLLVLDIAQALAHLWANIDGFTFSYQTSEYQQISTSLSIAEVHCRNSLWRIMLASKAPKITNFKIHNHFFKTVLPFLSHIIGYISPQSEIELIVNQWMSQKQQTLVLSSCLQKHTSEGNPVHQLIVANHSTNITQNCEHSMLFSFQTCEKIRKVKK